MALENELYFLVPSATPAFEFPVTASAEALDLTTMRLKVNVREETISDTWSIGAELHYKDKTHSYTFKVTSEYIHHLPKAPSHEHDKMVTSKRLVYGIAENLGSPLSVDSGLDKDFIIKSIRQFAKPNHNLITMVSTGPAVGFNTGGNDLMSLAQTLPGVGTKVGCCPATGEPIYIRVTEEVCKWTGDYPVYHLVMHLNDGHKWTREQIADWLDKLYAEGVDLAFKDE